MNDSDRRRGPMPADALISATAALYGLTDSECRAVRRAAKLMGTIQQAQATRMLGRRGWTGDTPEALIDRCTPTWQRRIRLLESAIDYARAKGWIAGNMYHYGSAA